MDEKALARAKEALLSKHKAERKALRAENNARLSGKKGPERTEAEEANTQAAEALAARHADELLRLEAGEAVEGAADAPQAAAAKSPVLGPNGKPLTKAQLRHIKKREAEREAEELAEKRKAEAGPTAREIELERVGKALEDLKLEVKEVEGDGHCLFRAVADQLVRTGQGSLDASTKDPHLLLRNMCAQYITSHRHQFEPYIAADESAGTVEKYCDRLKNTAEWGGQIELRALAGMLETPILVVGADSKPIKMGEEFSGDPLVVTYHRHYLSLGEHYNSVRPRAEVGGAPPAQEQEQEQ